uniref:Zinc finger and BTB domain containing 38 n=1 Tax=Sphaeramia orbicularis TaxID=375764 RepID=A0A673ANG1_9TELE
DSQSLLYLDHLMDSAHPHSVLTKLNEQRSQGLFCDVTIVVEDVKFRAHKNILAASSGYFKNALTTPETWSSSQVLELMDLKSEVFANILNFIYCSKLTSCGAEDTGGLVAAGKRLGIPFLEKLAEKERQQSAVPPNLSKCVKSTDFSAAPVPKKTKTEVPRLEETDSARGPRITNAFSITEVHLFCKFCHRKFIHLKRLRNHEQVCLKVVRGPPKLDANDTLAKEEFHSEGVSDTENTMTQEPPADLSTSDIPESLSLDEPDPLEDEKARIPGGHQRRYNCSVCKRVYVTLSSLKRHENVHSWQRAYPCHYCNKVFALAEYRTKHEIWHTGERRYQCIFCLETFMTYYILKNHQKSFHGIDPRLAVKKKAANGGLKASTTIDKKKKA